ncbi:MAG: WD40/YVTN/BNR-like repeat-containing protein, partial [Candidatus Kapaibacterium sp.]
VVQSPDSVLYVLADRTYRIEPSKVVTPIGLQRVVTSYQEFFNAPVAVWAIEDNRPFRSVNKGKDWKDMSFDWNKNVGTLFNILIDREANTYAFVRSDDTTRVYRLNSGGTSWTKVRDVARVFRDVLININGSFVASTDDGMYSSEDNGRSWTHTSRGISTYPLSCAVAIENAVCVAGFDGVISQTNTGGLSWSTANVPSRTGSQPLVVSELIKTSQGKVIAATSEGIWVSSDRGLNYIAGQRKDGKTEAVHSVAEIAPGILYATGRTALLTSRDGGLTWSVADSGSYDGASIARSANGRFIISSTRGLLSGDTSSSPPTVLTTAMNGGRCATSGSAAVYTAGYDVGIPGTFPVTLSRMKGKMQPENFSIPASRSSSRIPVWVAAGGDGEAYVNTDAGLYRLAQSSTTPERIDVWNEICTFVHSSSSQTIILATAYGGVYLLDVASAVDSEAETSMRSVPQPADDEVRFTSTMPIGRWRVVDIHGNVCIDGDAHGSETSLTVSTRHMASGMYVFVNESAVPEPWRN